MVFRVTSNQYIAQALAGSQLHSRNLATLQQQATTGLRVERPSDDPSAMRVILSNKARVQRMDTELANLNDARHRLDMSVTNLLEANNVLTKVHALTIEARQAIDPDQRGALANEVDRMVDRMISIANSDNAGQYLYGGQTSDQPPFVKTGQGGSHAVAYRGSEERGQILSSSINIDVLYTGADIFQSKSRGATVILGETGAAPGSAADSGVGRATLSVTHTATTYAGASGVLPGASSVSGDTILGPAGANTLTIVDTSGTGAFGTVSLNGGPPIDFTSADTDLQVFGVTGEQVFVDTTAIAPGFSGTIDITSDGTLSTDGGATTLPIDFSSANQQVVDSTNGEVVNIDSRNIRRTGDVAVEFTGTSDIFSTLLAIRDDLRNESLQGSALTESLGRRLADIERHRDNLMSVVGDQSATLESLDAIQQRTEDAQLQLAQITSDYESADILEVALNLQNEQALLQYTFSTSARLFDQTILNFLR